MIKTIYSCMHHVIVLVVDRLMFTSSYTSDESIIAKIVMIGC